MPKIPMGRTRSQDKPWLVIKGGGGWEWRVLKAYSSDPEKQYARWMCAVSSPYTFGGVDMGDTYISDIQGYITERDPEVPDEAIPSWLEPATVPSGVEGISVTRVIL